MSTIFPLMLYAYRHNALVAENYASFIILLLLDALGDFKKFFGTFGTLHCQLLPMLSYLHDCLDHISLVSCLPSKNISKNAQLSAC